ncbi:MAG: hypothetical protein HY235_25280 [Acidobacteria bacterium]|nr:hypothetical protein [Acidobacteriota bacterium]
MGVSFHQSQALNELARLLYDYLPDRPHPYAAQAISFAGVARDLDLMQFYSAGSKLPAITTLLLHTLERRSDRFCALVLEIVRRGMIYLQNKGQPIRREDIVNLNELVRRVGFKIPELWDPTFLESLPRRTPEPKEQSITASPEVLARLKQELVCFGSLLPQARGIAFERLLKDLFGAFALNPKGSIRLVGEQIDGSFELDGETYLMEAKFHSEQIGPGPLREFRDKVDGKASWSEGFSSPGQALHRRR